MNEKVEQICSFIDKFNISNKRNNDIKIKVQLELAQINFNRKKFNKATLNKIISLKSVSIVNPEITVQDKIKDEVKSSHHKDPISNLELKEIIPNQNDIKIEKRATRSTNLLKTNQDEQLLGKKRDCKMSANNFEYGNYSNIHKLIGLLKDKSILFDIKEKEKDNTKTLRFKRNCGEESQEINICFNDNEKQIKLIYCNIIKQNQLVQQTVMNIESLINLISKPIN